MEIIRENNRFRSLKTQDGHFRKEAVHPAYGELLQREVAFARWLNDAVSHGTLAAPTVTLDNTSDPSLPFYEAEWLHAVHFCERGQKLDQEDQRVIGREAAMILTTLDGLDALPLGKTSLWGKTLAEHLTWKYESAPHSHLGVRIPSWMTEDSYGPLKTGALTEKDFEKLKTRLAEQSRMTQGGCIQHGDFTPWHLLRDQKAGKYYLINGGKASPAKPRYYDLAYFITRAISERWWIMATNCLSSFMGKLPPYRRESFRSAFAGVLLLRAAGILRDAEIDAIHRKVDYRKVAGTLFHTCLNAEDPVAEILRLPS